MHRGRPRAQCELKLVISCCDFNLDARKRDAGVPYRQSLAAVVVFAWVVVLEGWFTSGFCTQQKRNVQLLIGNQTKYGAYAL